MRPTIVFDLDGTLVDSAPDLAATLNHILASEGLPAASEAEVHRMVGRGARTLITRAFAANGRTLAPERLEELFDAFLIHYEANIDGATRPFDGVTAALDRFEAEGWTLAVCTNKTERLARLLLAKLGMAERFATIVGQETFGITKPDPRHILMTIEAVGGDPARAVMVGDSVNDIDAAKAAGVPVVAVTFGYTDRPVTELGPDVIIDHFDGLWDAVRGLGVTSETA